MKYILPLILILILTATSQAWPFKKEPVIKPVPQAVAQPIPKSPLQEGKEIVKGIAGELKAAKEENIKLKASLDKAVEQVKDAESRTAVVQKQANDLKDWGMIQQAEAQKFMEKYNSAVKRYHRLKILAAMIAGAAGILFGLQFINLVPAPYNLLVPVGGAAFFASLVWFFL